MSDFEYKKNADASELEVYLAFFGYVQRHTKVASLAFINSIDGNMVKVTPFPILEGQTEKQISAYCLSDSDKQLISNGYKLCLIIYCDMKFSDNLRNYLSTNFTTVYSSKSELHSEMNAVIARVFDINMED